MAERPGTNQNMPEYEPQDLQTVNTEFMKEQIKQRPVNRKKLLRRTVITFCMAVLFGTVACIVFMIVQPIVTRMLSPHEEPETVTFEEETPTEEISPEELIRDDAEIVQQEVDQQTQANQLEAEALREEVKTSVLDELEGVDVYAGNYSAMAALAAELSSSMVTVTGISSDYDWVGDAFEDATNKTSGMMIADTESEYYIFANGEEITGADEIRVTFSTGEEADAAVKMTDRITGAVVLAARKEGLTQETIDAVSPVVLGSSARADLLGQPVIAIGSPSGTPGSVSYGIVTNAALSIDVTDSVYNRITTDIYGSSLASGAVVDLKGRVIGWITMDYNASDSPNLISAVGITEMKKLLEQMSNERDIAYLGVHIVTVPESVNADRGVPLGAYVTRVELDSPAMDAGIQSGDIITGFYGNPVTRAADLVTQLQSATPWRSVRMTLMRQTGDDYHEVTVNAVVSARLERD